MVYFWLPAVWCSNYGYDVKAAGILQFTVLDVMVHGTQQITLFVVVDSRKWVGKVPVVPGLYLHKDNPFAILCYYVDVAVA